MSDDDREKWFWAEIDRYRTENTALREALVSFTKSDYIKTQHPKRYAAAINALKGETNV